MLRGQKWPQTPLPRLQNNNKFSSSGSKFTPGSLSCLYNTCCNKVINYFLFLGYGNNSPKSWGGRFFCVCYALIGIPLMFIFLADLGKVIHASATRNMNKIFSKFKCCEKWCKRRKALAVATYIFLVGHVLHIWIPSIANYFAEDWTFFESVYYNFITLTTIGFGDYVAGLYVFLFFLFVFF